MVRPFAPRELSWPAIALQLLLLMAACQALSACKEEETTAAPTPIPSATASPSPTPSATASPSPTPSATASPTPTPTPMVTPTPTPVDSPSPTPTPMPTPTVTYYQVGGYASGLHGTLTLAVTDTTGTNPLALAQDGPFWLPDSYATGDGYDVEVMAQPPHQACDVQSGVGVVANNNVSDVAVACHDTNTLTISLDVIGITTSDVLSATYEGATLQVGPSPIVEHLDPNTAYAIGLVSPAGYQCTASANDLVGTMPSTDLVIQVDCIKQTYAVTFSATGLVGGDSITILDQSTSDPANNQNGIVLTPNAATQVWANPVDFADSVTVALAGGNAHLTCAFANQQNTFTTIVPAAALSIPITCGHQYDLSGTVSGLYTGASISVALGGATQVVNANAPTFAFPSGLTGGAGWNLTLSTQPRNQLCTANPNAGTATDQVSNVVVQCAPYLRLTTQQNANVVIGQPNFSADGSGPGNSNNAWGQVYGSPFVTPGGALVFNDSQFGRTLIYDSVPTINGAGARTIITGNGNIPTGVASDSNHFVVINSSTKTVNVTRAFPPTTVNPNFTLGGNHSCNPNTIEKPSDAWMAAGMMAIADAAGSRVLIWYAPPTTQNQPPDAVLGQPNLISCGSTTLDATTLRNVGSVWFNAQLTMAASIQDNRVSIWNRGPHAISNGQPADVVLGAPDKVTAGTGAASQSTFAPWKVLSNGTQVFIVDSNNNRVLIWNSIPQVDGQPADVVLGQADWTSSAANGGAPTSTWTLNHPYGAAISSTALIVNDHASYRMLVFLGQ